MTSRGVPEVATPALMGRTLAIFYAFGGLTGLLAAAGADGDPVRRWAVVGLASSALATAGVIARWSGAFPRVVFHVLVAMATTMISAAALVTADATSAVLVSMIMAFIAMDVFFFFPPAQGAAQLGYGMVAITAALLTRGDVAVAHAIGSDLIVVAIALVTHGLAQQASGASRDPLTGLRNRRGFDDALGELVADAERTGAPLSVALVDLDHFKAINDATGHDGGDATLRRMAEQWSRALPPESVLARHGGDEFALLLPGTRGTDALALLRRVAADHADPAVSVGVAEHRTWDSGAQTMRDADQALYGAKAAGRARCALFEPDRHDRAA